MLPIHEKLISILRSISLANTRSKVRFESVISGVDAIAEKLTEKEKFDRLVEWAKEVEANGAGEILLTSVDRDGTFEGYDVPLTRAVADAVKIPVIASGGCGKYAHMAEVLRDGKATAVAAASIFHFTEQTPREAKAYLKAQGFSVRL